MGKKIKKGVSDAVYAKKSVAQENPFASAIPTGRKINPFEVHVNKEKFQILGRECKHDKGLPGVSRAKAIKKRAQTIGKEFRVKHKSNHFRDRRIGRYLKDDELTEEVLNARFIADKVDKIRGNKHSKFNLDDTEVLTHRGQTLEDIEQFRDDRSDDDDDDNDLDAKFTEAAHFGGDEQSAKDRQSAIDEMISEQKRKKIEIAKEKDEIFEMTEKLDSTYKNLISVVSKGIQKNSNDKKISDDFDKVMREMLFEPRGHVADKLVSEEELVKKEKDRLELLEKERLKRMNGDIEEEVEKPKPTHRSADDLDDGYFANSYEEEDNTLTYTLDGKLNNKKNGEVVSDDDDLENHIEDKEDDHEENGEGDSEEEEDDDDDDDEEGEGDSSSDEDNLSDLKESDSEEEKTNDVKNPIKSVPVAKKIKVSPEELENDGDIPFTLNMPESYEDFLTLISNKKPKLQATVVDRLIKCNHPKLDPANLEEIVKLFTFLLQYINELFSDAHIDNIKIQFETFGQLNPFLFDLFNINSETMSKILLNVITEKYSEYRKNSKEFPPLETIIFFKIVSNVFSTSDYRHPVVTPCYIFIQQVLSRAKLKTRQDIALGLFLVTIVLEFSYLSKRFLPAAFNFLLGIIYLSIPKRPIEVVKIIPPFPSTGPMSKILAISPEDVDGNTTEKQLSSEDLVSLTFNALFKITALNTSLKLVKEMIDISGDTVGANYLAAPFLEMLKKVPLDLYPAFLQKNLENAQKSLQSIADKSLHKLVPPAKKPKALRLLEPRFEAVYDDKRRPKLTKEKEERVKLLAKIKRETKGAVREIRRDTEYLQKIKIKQQIQGDMERKEKVKRIYQEAAMQQGELNELARLKKKKKF